MVNYQKLFLALCVLWLAALGLVPVHGAIAPPCPCEVIEKVIGEGRFPAYFCSRCKPNSHFPPITPVLYLARNENAAAVRRDITLSQETTQLLFKNNKMKRKDCRVPNIEWDLLSFVGIGDCDPTSSIAFVFEFKHDTDKKTKRQLNVTAYSTGAARITLETKKPEKFNKQPAMIYYVYEHKKRIENMLKEARKQKKSAFKTQEIMGETPSLISNLDCDQVIVRVSVRCPAKSSTHWTQAVSQFWRSTVDKQSNALEYALRSFSEAGVRPQCLAALQSATYTAVKALKNGKTRKPPTAYEL